MLILINVVSSKFGDIKTFLDKTLNRKSQKNIMKVMTNIYHIREWVIQVGADLVHHIWWHITQGSAQLRFFLFRSNFSTAEKLQSEEDRKTVGDIHITGVKP